MLYHKPVAKANDVRLSRRGSAGAAASAKAPPSIARASSLTDVPVQVAAEIAPPKLKNAYKLGPAPPDNNSSRSVAAATDLSSRSLLMLEPKRPRRSEEELDALAVLDELFSGQHLLWKTRQRLNLVLSLCCSGKTLVIDAERVDDDHEQKLPLLFCDVRLLKKATSASHKAEFATLLAKREVRGPLPYGERTSLEDEVFRSVLVTWVLRRVALLDDIDKKEAVQLKLLSGDALSIEDLLLPADSPLIPIRLGGAEVDSRPRRRPSLEDFQETASVVDVHRTDAKMHREAGTDLRNKSMTLLNEALRAATLPRLSWDDVDFRGKWKLLMGRVMFRVKVHNMKKKLEYSPAFQAFQAVYMAKRRLLAEQAAAAASQPVVVAKDTAIPDDQPVMQDASVTAPLPAIAA